MNKPATKEPSMDEILSSIRQIIADDDASAAPPPPRPAPVAPAPAPIAARPAPAPVMPAPRPAAEPLALSPSQIVSTPEPASAAGDDINAMLAEIGGAPEAAFEAEPVAEMDAHLIDPEDIAFEMEPELPEPVRAPEPPPARPAMAVSRAAPMPDPTLSSEMAEKLLAPTTDAAVQSAMSRLGAVADTGMRGITVEAMMREMLRPMLKEWLDENLPALVEGMVEREIARISRGVK